MIDINKPAAQYRRSIQLAATSTRAAALLMTVLMFMAVVGCDIESNFNLANSSRLPRWFTLPAGVTRSQVSVELVFYTDDRAQLILRDSKGKQLASVMGREIGKLDKNGNKTNDAGNFPVYEIITAAGTIEAAEFRAMEPIFRVSDDPLILARASSLPRH